MMPVHPSWGKNPQAGILMHTGSGPREWWAGSAVEGDCHGQLFGPFGNDALWMVWTQGRAGGTAWTHHPTQEAGQQHIRRFFGRPLEWEHRR